MGRDGISPGNAGTYAFSAVSLVGPQLYTNDGGLSLFLIEVNSCKLPSGRRRNKKKKKIENRKDRRKKKKISYMFIPPV